MRVEDGSSSEALAKTQGLRCFAALGRTWAGVALGLRFVVRGELRCFAALSMTQRAHPSVPSGQVGCPEDDSASRLLSATMAVWCRNIVKKTYHVYIMSNVSKMLYTGVTNDLEHRVFQHKTKEVDGFTKKYNIHRLVYFEAFGEIREAIAREKQIKGWLRAKKVALIESVNPEWRDLAPEWMKKGRATGRVSS